MIITPRQQFHHAGYLPARFDSYDPRRPDLIEEHVEVDLRACRFIRPPAVLWCLIYPLLSRFRSYRCSLHVPDNLGVCLYLKSIALLQILKDAGVEVDDRDIEQRSDPQVVLPLTKFETESDVDDIANDVFDALGRFRQASHDVYAIVSETFGELAYNAVQHSESPVGGYGFIQFYESRQGRRFVCGVADGGIGIRRSLERNPALRGLVPYDWVAIERATGEGVSGTGDRTRGIGLYGVSEDMRRRERQLIVHSGIGSLQFREQMQSRASRTRLFPGTAVYVSIPC